MMQKQLCLLAALSLALAVSCADSQGASTATATATAAAAPLGAYLGCFDLEHVKSLPGLLETGEAPHTASTLYLCPAACREGNFSITFISTSLRCWCALATPHVNASMPISACTAGGPGVAAFYQHDLAATHWCKIVPTPLTPDDISVDYNQHNVEFTAATALATNTTDLPAQMRIRMEGSSGARVRPKAPPQLYGQFEVTAKVTEAVGAVTAFYVRDSDEYNQDNSGDFEEIDVEFLNGHPGIPNSVWFNSYHRGLSRGEQLTKPEVYQRLLNLTSSANNTNTWLTYTFTWQPSHVMWAINGVPILRRTTGELVRWSDMGGRPFERIFVSPDRPMHVSFSMWNDNSRFHFGGELDYSKSPYYSYFRELRRIACVDPLPANATEPYGPTWLYDETSSWPAAPVPAYTAPPIPSSSPSLSPSPSPSPLPSNSCVSSPQVNPVKPASGSSPTNTSQLPTPSPEQLPTQPKTSLAPSAGPAPEPTPVNTAVRGSSSSPVVPPKPVTHAAPAPVAVMVPVPAPPAPAAAAATIPTNRLQPAPSATQATPATVHAKSPAPAPVNAAPPQRSTAAETITAPVKAPSLVPSPALAVPAAPAPAPTPASPPQKQQEAQQDMQHAAQPQRVVALPVSTLPPVVVTPSQSSPVIAAAATSSTPAGQLVTVPSHPAAIAFTQQPDQTLPEAGSLRPHPAAAAAADVASRKGVRRSRRWLQEARDSWQGAVEGEAPLAEALETAW